MRTTVAAGVLLIASVAVSGCGSEPTCDDVRSLERQLAETEPEDPDYNTVVNKLNQAQADCNAR